VCVCVCACVCLCVCFVSTCGMEHCVDVVLCHDTPGIPHTHTHSLTHTHTHTHTRTDHTSSFPPPTSRHRSARFHSPTRASWPTLPLSGGSRPTPEQLHVGWFPSTGHCAGHVMPAPTFIGQVRTRPHILCVMSAVFLVCSPCFFGVRVWCGCTRMHACSLSRARLGVMLPCNRFRCCRPTQRTTWMCATWSHASLVVVRSCLLPPVAWPEKSCGGTIKSPRFAANPQFLLRVGRHPTKPTAKHRRVLVQVAQEARVTDVGTSPFHTAGATKRVVVVRKKRQPNNNNKKKNKEKPATAQTGQANGGEEPVTEAHGHNSSGAAAASPPGAGAGAGAGEGAGAGSADGDSDTTAPAAPKRRVTQQVLWKHLVPHARTSTVAPLPFHAVGVYAFETAYVVSHPACVVGFACCAAEHGCDGCDATHLSLSVPPSAPLFIPSLLFCFHANKRRRPVTEKGMPPQHGKAKFTNAGVVSRWVDLPSAPMPTPAAANTDAGDGGGDGADAATAATTGAGMAVATGSDTEARDTAEQEDGGDGDGNDEDEEDEDEVRDPDTLVLVPCMYKSRGACRFTLTVTSECPVELTRLAST